MEAMIKQDKKWRRDRMELSVVVAVLGINESEIF
jgi:hypothetical protein